MSTNPLVGLIRTLLSGLQARADTRSAGGNSRGRVHSEVPWDGLCSSAPVT